MDTTGLSPVSVLAAAVVLTGGLVLAGCSTGGSSASSTTRTSAKHSTTTTVSASTTTTTDQNALHYAATATFALPGNAELVEKISIGSVKTGNPPPANGAVAINSCPTVSEGGNQYFGDAYVPGQVTMTYQGAVPDTFALSGLNPQLQDLSTTSLSIAQEVQGSWSCTNGGSDQSLELQPGGSLTIPLWFVGTAVISNTAPTFVESDHYGWGFVINYPGEEASRQAAVLSLAGPNVVSCQLEGAIDGGPSAFITVFPPPSGSFPTGGAGTPYSCGPYTPGS